MQEFWTPDYQEELSYAVVDASNRPLCHLHGAEIVRQRLRHRSVALLLCDDNGKMLLKFRPGVGFGFTEFCMVPAQCGMEELAWQLAQDKWHRENCALVEAVEPCEANGFSFCGIFLAKFPHRLGLSLLSSDKNLLLADKVEVSALIDRGHAFAQFFRIQFSGGHLPGFIQTCGNRTGA